MKVIQVVGPSDSGKTTFITSLIRELSRKGRVAAVKHSPDHEIALEHGKDTTRMYGAGADTAGIDPEKAMVLLHECDLPRILDLFCDAGVDYAIVEGFKSHAYPRIVIGERDDPLAVLTNPTVAETIETIYRFCELHSTTGMVRSLLREADMDRTGAIVTFQGIVRKKTGDTETAYFDVGEEIYGTLDDVRKDIETIPGILGVRTAHRTGRLYPGEGITYLAVVSEHRHEAFDAIRDAIDRIKQGHQDSERNIS